MTDVYVVRNQLGQFWGKAKTWTDGRDARAIMRTAHEDEAMNTLFELSSKDIELRGEVVHVPLSERREPVVDPSEHLIEPEETEDATAPQTQVSAATDTPDKTDKPAENPEAPSTTSLEPSATN